MNAMYQLLGDKTTSEGSGDFMASGSSGGFEYSVISNGS